MTSETERPGSEDSGTTSETERPGPEDTAVLSESEQSAPEEPGMTEQSVPEDPVAPNEKDWFILKVAGGSEKKISAMLTQRAKFHNLDSLIEEIFIPAEEVTLKRQGKEKKKMITYYPGYIIIKAEMTDELWHLIKEAPKISGFVGGTQKKPNKISMAELNAIKSQINQGIKQAELNSTYQIGQGVRIVEGPFAEFNGIVDAVDAEHNKLTVKVSIFGRATPIELDFDKVKTNT